MRIMPRIYSISDILAWHQRDELNLQPAFQRRPTWSKSAKSYLIDTIVRGLPIPKIFIREHIVIDERKTIREVVDGQQRLRAVLEFIEDEIELSRVHNKEFAGMSFSDLPEEIKSEFLSYEISTDLLVGASDADVLNVFSRINSYTLTLNQQEKLNAQFVGPLKQVVYQLAFEHHEFWVRNSILTNTTIARMGDAELVSEIVISMMHGLQSGKSYLKRYYEIYENDLPNSDEIIARFHRIIDLIGSIFGSELKNSAFSRSPIFYSLFLALFDIMFGVGENGVHTPVRIPKPKHQRLFQELKILSDEISKAQPTSKYEAFYTAATRRTTNVRERRTRHKYIKDAIEKAL